MRTHASFFSGAGGMDIGLERAGWRTVSFSEIEPYASAVLAERWPGVPNLGDITGLLGEPGRVPGRDAADVDWRNATLWTGGFPCQDLSVAGKRGGIDAARSGLAWSFLALVERHRPEAIVLENVAGLLTANAGRDLGRLLREVGDLGYGWAYRVLDSQWFGVPQRRRRVFIVALDIDRHPDPDSAAEVLCIGHSCRRDHQTELPERTPSADGLASGIARCLSTSNQRNDGDTESFVVCTTPDAIGMRETDGLAGWVDVGEGVEAPVMAYPVIGTELDERLNPKGLDTSRYRVIGNGVVAPVAEWVGARLASHLESARRG